MNIIEELDWRGLISDCTDRGGLEERLANNSLVLYAGFDPTADSLHVGNLVPLLGLRRFQLAGHTPIAMAGGATGSIGDPSGKSAERQLLSYEQLEANIASVKIQLRSLLDFETDDNPARLLDNASWTREMGYLDFLREVGKFFTVNSMVAKESVRARMQDREVGISYTEFSYMLLQAYDFYYLNKFHHCELQIGGSDQWGNITAGIDLCRKKQGSTVHGLTLPLITNADGSKFGKSEAGAIWIDRSKTSVYRFYQFWIRTDDRDVIRYLKFFTFLGREQIAELERQQVDRPEARIAQQALAGEMTELVHGAQATTEAKRASEILFGGGLEGITEETFNEIVGEVPTRTVAKSRLQGEGLSLSELTVAAGLCPSKGQARKDINSGGVYLNNVRQTEFQRQIRTDDLLFSRHLLVRKGKRNYVVVSVK